MTEPRAAPDRLRNNFETSQVLLLRLAGIAAALAAVPIAAVAGSAGSIRRHAAIFAAGVILGTLALILGLSGWILGLQARRVRRMLREFEEGRYLAHWTDFTPEEAAAFIAEAYPKLIRKTSLVARVVTAIIMAALAFGVTLGVLEGNAGDDWILVVFVTAAAAALGIAAGGLLGRRINAAHRARFARLGTAGLEVFVGHSGAWFAEEYLPFNHLFHMLAAAEVVEGSPPKLRLTVRVSSGEAYSVQTRDLPVPAARLEEARAVVAMLPPARRRA